MLQFAKKGAAMKLKNWMIKENVSREHLAKFLNTTVQAIGYYVNEQKIPRPETMAKIVAYTKGEVTANDFYGIEEKSE